MLPLQWYCIIL